MNQLHLLLVAIVSGLISYFLFQKLFNRDPVKLVEYTSLKGNFRGVMPANYQEFCEYMTTSAGKLVVNLTKGRSRFHQFIVCYSDYPQPITDVKYHEKMLDGARDGVVAKVKGELLKEIRFNFQGAKAREIHVVVKPRAVMRTRIMFVGNRMYQLQVVSSPRRISYKKVNEFFEGFSLLS